MEEKVKLVFSLGTILNVFQYHLLHDNSYFGKVPFLFISVGVLCEFAMMPDVYILSSPQEKKYTLFPEETDEHIRQHIHQKDLNLCLPLCYYAKVIVELEKMQTMNSTVL